MAHDLSGYWDDLRAGSSRREVPVLVVAALGGALRSVSPRATMAQGAMRPRAAPRRLRNAALSAKPAAGQRVRLQPGAVRLGDRAHDREPEPEPFVAAGAAVAVALERLE